MSAMKARFQIAECSQPSPCEKGLGESGGALFKGKEGRGDFRKTSFERRQVQSDTAMGNKYNFFQKLISVTTCNISGDAVLVI